MRTNLLLLVVAAVVLMSLASCATHGVTAEQGAGIVVAGASALSMFVDDLLKSGVIDAAQAAKLQAIATNVHGTVDAVRAAVGPVADLIGAIKGTVTAQSQQIVELKASSLTTGDVLKGAAIGAPVLAAASVHATSVVRNRKYVKAGMAVSGLKTG